MTDDSASAGPTEMAAATGDGPAIDKFGLPVRPRSKLAACLAAAWLLVGAVYLLGGAVVAGWMAVRADVHDAEPHLWWVGVVAAFSWIALFGLPERLHIVSPVKTLNRIVGAVVVVDILFAINLAGILVGAHCSGSCSGA